MRIAYFTTTGPIARIPLEALCAAGHEVALVVRPRGRNAASSRIGGLARRFGLLPRDPVAEFAREHRLPSRREAGPGDSGLARALSQARVDLICVSSYRWLLPPSVLAAARLGGINLHSSLLPRHRGPLPLFWTYREDDRTAGVSVHRLSPAPDAGDILSRSGAPLERGFPVERLDGINASRGAALLVSAVEAIAQGSAHATPQDDSQATRAPLIRPGVAAVDFERWPAERVWHFLRGLFPRFQEPVRDQRGRPVSYSGVLGYEPDASPVSSARLGQVDASRGRASLRCRDGWVQLAVSGR